jgi:hypothetical protein
VSLLKWRTSTAANCGNTPAVAVTVRHVTPSLVAAAAKFALTVFDSSLAPTFPHRGLSMASNTAECAIDANGQLKDAQDIEFYGSESNERPLAPLAAPTQDTVEAAAASNGKDKMKNTKGEFSFPDV